MQDEAVLLVGAGQETVRATLTLITFWLLKNPDKMERVRNEILTIWPDLTERPSLPQLEKLPYLSAAIQEGSFLSRLC